MGSTEQQMSRRAFGASPRRVQCKTSLSFFLVLCRWYHGSLSRSEAESLLTLCKESSYLVRNSQTCRNDYSLSLRWVLVFRGLLGSKP